jgi:hypothetical protein
MSYCSLRDCKVVSKFRDNVARPKSDLASLATFGVGAFGLRKVNKLEKSFREHAIAQQEGQQQIMRGLQTIAELQVASLYMLREIDAKLTTLSDIAWDISTYLQRKEQKDEFLGDLRLVIRAINSALDDIDIIAETNLEYATLQIEIILALADKHDVRIEHFKHSHEDMDRAEDVLKRLDSTHRDYLRRLEAM